MRRSAVLHKENIIIDVIQKQRMPLMIMMATVVFVVTYLLILPAFTLDEEEAAQQGGIDVPAAVQQELDFEGDGYSIALDADAKAGLPEGTQVIADEVTSDAGDYEAWCDEALKALQDAGAAEENTAISSARFYDISLSADGQAIEPEAPVSVRISYDKAIRMKSSEGLRVVHFASDGEGGILPEVLDEDAVNINGEGGSGAVRVSDVAFEAAGFSMYAIVGTELETEIVLPGSTDTYTVKVTAPAEAQIPQGSTLRVVSFEEGSEQYEYARNAVLADKKEKGEHVFIDAFNLAALDISIIDPDGNEIEPAAAVKVDIKIKELPGVEDFDTIKDSLEIQHHVEVEDGVVIEKVFDGSAEGSFQMDTREKAAEEGKAVDPNSVSEEDFRSTEKDDFSIDASFDTNVFSTFTVTWQYAYGNNVRVHYVDENGQELTVANSVFPTSLDQYNSTVAHLIYDIDGYEYDHTYRRYYNYYYWDQMNIVPELRAGDYGWAYSMNGNGWTYLSHPDNNKDEIYVVYKKKADVTQGGTPTLKPVRPEDYPEEPSILKESEPNGDGTADLSLSIIGHTKEREVEKLADVIVVMDVSGSMNFDLAGTKEQRWDSYNYEWYETEVEYGNNDPKQRLYQAKEAVNKLAEDLSKKKNSDGDPLIRMSLISFSNSADQVIGLTDLDNAGLASYKSAVNGLSASGGTNWEAALQLANQQAVDSGRATFVIFVTDGDPTFRNSRTNTTDSELSSNDIYEGYYLNSNYNVFGTGHSDERNNNYNTAVAQGQTIVGAGKNLYTIGISEDVKKVGDFNTDAGGNGAYIASNTAALNQAFSDIEASIIAMIGFSDIQMTDGITEMTQTVDKSGLTTTDGSFTYWKKGKDDTEFSEWDPASEGAEEAVYDSSSGAVKWNMGTNFMPEDGATYKVTWKVWPSQEAYDILAECQNDPTFYDTLTDAQKAQIAKTGSAPNFTYTLRTNEPGAGTRYKSATKSGSGITTEGDYKDLLFNEVNPLGLASSQIHVEKVWDNQLDSRVVTGSYTFPVKGDGQEFGEGVVLSSDQNPQWKNSYYISTGLMTTDPYVIYEKGHDYTVEEPVDLSYNWDFKSDVYHPMVIDNKTVNLIKVDSQAEADYTIDGKYYKKLEGDATLTAVNERRSNLNISKTVVDQDGNHIRSS